jgi:hypothetical protein
MATVQLRPNNDDKNVVIKSPSVATNKDLLE